MADAQVIFQRRKIQIILSRVCFAYNSFAFLPPLPFVVRCVCPLGRFEACMDDITKPLFWRSKLHCSPSACLEFAVGDKVECFYEQTNSWHVAVVKAVARPMEARDGEGAAEGLVDHSIYVMFNVLQGSSTLPLGGLVHDGRGDALPRFLS